MLEVVFTQVGPWVLLVGVLAGGFWLLAKGILVPAAALRDRERIADLYRKAFEREHTARELADKQLEEMRELSRTATHVLTELPKLAPPAAASNEGDGNAPSQVA